MPRQMLMSHSRRLRRQRERGGRIGSAGSTGSLAQAPPTPARHRHKGIPGTKRQDLRRKRRPGARCTGTRACPERSCRIPGVSAAEARARVKRRPGKRPCARQATSEYVGWLKRRPTAELRKRAVFETKLQPPPRPLRASSSNRASARQSRRAYRAAQVPSDREATQKGCVRHDVAGPSAQPPPRLLRASSDKSMGTFWEGGGANLALLQARENNRRRSRHHPRYIYVGVALY